MAAKLEKTRHPGIYRRGSRYVVTFRDATGKQRKESARTLDDARLLKAKRTSQVADGEHNPDGSLTFREYAEEWVERYQGKGKRGFREHTRADYRRDLTRHAIPFFKGMKLRQIKTPHVSKFVAHLCDEEAQGRYLADGTVHRIFVPLQSMMATAVSEGVIPSNPCREVSLPARDEQRAIETGTDTDEPKAKALTTVELETFLMVCPPDWHLFFRVLASTGLRISEAFALRWRDLDLEVPVPVLKVRRAYVRGKFGPPKSQRGKRTIPLTFDVVQDLIKAKTESPFHGPDDLVFPARNGKPLRTENVRRRVLAPAAREAGVPWIGFHTFRHTCATRLFDEGRNTVQVQRWLGHSSPAFTLNVYVHLLDEDLGGPLETPGGGNKVATQAPETARNTRIPEPSFSHR